MSEELLLLIGERLRAKRMEKKVTVGALAARAGVSKGLVSQIENNRTVPSLPVLFNLIHSLEEDVKSFFDDMQDHFENAHVRIIRRGEGTKFVKEPVRGLTYRRLLTRTLNFQTVDMVMLELAKGAGRSRMIRTDAYECKYVLKGTIEYQIEKEVVRLNAGDMMFFDGRAAHRLKNVGTGPATLLVFYFF
jgi:transcriptional regulator with XRE-family HTH domain